MGLLSCCTPYLALQLFAMISAVQTLTTERSTLSMPLNVMIWTAGIYKKDIDLVPLLSEVLPRYSPPLDSDTPAHDVQMHINYVHKEAPKSFTDNYSNYIVKQEKDSDGYYTIIINEFASFLEKELEQTGFKTGHPVGDTFSLPILIVNLPQLPKHMFVAHAPAVDEYMTDKCSLSVIANVAFIDFSARACDLHAFITHNAKQVRWFAPDLAQPYPFTFPTAEEAVYTPPKGAYNSHLSSRMMGVVTSAVQSLSTGSLKWRPTHSTVKIFCPIIILKSGGIVENGSERRIHPNLPVIKKWLSSLLLPSQELVLVSADHFVDEHPMLSVAIAAAHMTFASVVRGARGEEHVERVPYIDSNVLFHELTTVGDSLCNMLLMQTGHGEMLHNLILAEMLNNQTALAASYGSKTVRKKAEISAEDRLLKTAVVVPIFVLSDLHIHNERHLNTHNSGKESASAASASASASASSSAPAATPREPPVQPLLDKDTPVAVDTDSSSVIVVHSSAGFVSTFSPYTRNWRDDVDLTDVDSLVAEGLTRALTGLNAPHAQLQDAKDTLDITWTHGSHPFHPFGYLPPEAKSDSHHGVLAGASRRSILISRSHRALQRAGAVLGRFAALAGEIDQVHRFIHSVNWSVPGGGRSLEAKGMAAGSLGPGEVALNVDKDLPSLLHEKITDSSAKQSLLSDKLSDLRKGFLTGSLGVIESSFTALERMLEDLEAYLDQIETEVHAQMKNCHIAFDYDRHLSQIAPVRSADKGLPGGKGSNARTAGAGSGTSMGGAFLALVGVVVFAGVVGGLWYLSTYMLERAKKMK